MQYDYVLYSNKRTNFESADIIVLFDKLGLKHIDAVQKGSDIWMPYAPGKDIHGFARVKIIRITREKNKARVLYSCDRCYLYNQGIEIVASKMSEDLHIVNDAQRFLELVGEDPKYRFIGE